MATPLDHADSSAEATRHAPCRNCEREITIFRRGCCRSCYRKLGEAGLPIGPRDTTRMTLVQRRRRARERAKQERQWAARVRRSRAPLCGLCGLEQIASNGMCRQCCDRFRKSGFPMPPKVLSVASRWAQLRRWVLRRISGDASAPPALTTEPKEAAQLALPLGGVK